MSEYERHLIDSGYYDITPEQEAELDRDELVEKLASLRAKLESAEQRNREMRKALFGARSDIEDWIAAHDLGDDGDAGIRRSQWIIDQIDAALADQPAGAQTEGGQ